MDHSYWEKNGFQKCSLNARSTKMSVLTPASALDNMTPVPSYIFVISYAVFIVTSDQKAHIMSTVSVNKIAFFPFLPIS